MGTIVRNLSLLMIVALPIAVVTGGALVKLFPPDWARDVDTGLGSAFSALAFQYVALALPVLVGGVLHQVLLWATSRRSLVHNRTWVMISSVVVVVPLLLPRMNPARLFSWLVLAPMIVGLTIYGLTIRTPVTSSGVTEAAT